jgi:hypothetical protein
MQHDEQRADHPVLLGGDGAELSSTFVEEAVPPLARLRNQT